MRRTEVVIAAVLLTIGIAAYGMHLRLRGSGQTDFYVFQDGELERTAVALLVIVVGGLILLALASRRR